MRLRNVPRAREVIEKSPFVIQDPEAHKGNWHQVFSEKNDTRPDPDSIQDSIGIDTALEKRPVFLEIGTGKGRFILELAQMHPEINYIGIEKYSSVLLRGVERQNELQLPNLRFIRGEAELITEYFAKGEISRIYLNFSDPWPKNRNAKRRLPSREFLRRYDRILTPDGTIEFKTDNRMLFDFAVNEVPASSFFIDAITYDLHNDSVMNVGNVMTEYEEKFSAKGNKICKYILKRKNPVDKQISME